jgi:hypothetical protein
MERSEVSKTYFVACDMIHDFSNDLYESLHDDNGSPITDTDTVKGIIKLSKSKLYQELDLITEVTIEYNEQNINGNRKSFSKML